MILVLIFSSPIVLVKYADNFIYAFFSDHRDQVFREYPKLETGNLLKQIIRNKDAWIVIYIWLFAVLRGKFPGQRFLFLQQCWIWQIKSYEKIMLIHGYAESCKFMHDPLWENNGEKSWRWKRCMHNAGWVKLYRQESIF